MDLNKFKRLREILIRKNILNVTIEMKNKNKDEVESQNGVVDGINKEETQCLNYFPKCKTKHIDYVIYYKETLETQSNNELLKFREKFFKKLKQEEFDCYFLKETDIKNQSLTHVYVLLNCSLDRLMDEAERIELEWPLKPVSKEFKNALLKLLKCFSF